MKKYAVITALSILALILCAKIAGHIIDNQFSQQSQQPFYSGCFKVWGHRGYANGVQENSITSFTRAFDLGAAGVELDVYYDPSMNAFIVSHNKPHRLKDGVLLTLETVFKAVGSRGYFWLDLKNLGKLSDQQTKQLAEQLIKLMKRYDLRDKVIVESRRPLGLAVISQAGIHTSFWIAPKADNPFFKPYIYLAKLLHLYGHFSAFSISISHYNSEVQHLLSPLPIHLFTLNDQSQIVQLSPLDGISIILSDENFYATNSCPTALN